MDKRQAEIEKKQNSLGKLNPEQKNVYAIVKERINGMSKKKKMKLLLRKSNLDKLIADVRKELK